MERGASTVLQGTGKERQGQTGHGGARADQGRGAIGEWRPVGRRAHAPPAVHRQVQKAPARSLQGEGAARGEYDRVYAVLHDTVIPDQRSRPVAALHATCNLPAGCRDRTSAFLHDMYGPGAAPAAKSGRRPCAQAAPPRPAGPAAPRSPVLATAAPVPSTWPAWPGRWQGRAISCRASRCRPVAAAVAAAAAKRRWPLAS